MSLGDHIEGWMSEEELDWLYATAATMESVAEIGCWKGRSTFALLSGCKGKVYAVDHWQGTNPGQERRPHFTETEVGIDVFQIFLTNVGHFPNLFCVGAPSPDGAALIPRVLMVFIDGDHEYPFVVADLDAWIPKATKLICGHDFDYPPVRQAVLERFGEVQTVGTIWFKYL
jgi:hypothetical protein